MEYGRNYRNTEGTRATVKQKIKSDTPRTDAALDKNWTILDESLENVSKVSKKLERENNKLFSASYSARFILEDVNAEKLSEACGLPLGVIVDALENIFKP